MALSKCSCTRLANSLCLSIAPDLSLCLLIVRVQLCTFKLILKNSASLLDADDPLKVAAEERLANLIR